MSARCAHGDRTRAGLSERVQSSGHIIVSAYEVNRAARMQVAMSPCAVRRTAHAQMRSLYCQHECGWNWCVLARTTWLARRTGNVRCTIVIWALSRLVAKPYFDLWLLGKVSCGKHRRFNSCNYYPRYARAANFTLAWNQPYLPQEAQYTFFTNACETLAYAPLTVTKNGLFPHQCARY